MIPAQSKDITADWLNEVLRESGFLKDSKIESITHTPMAIGKGFMSDMARITLKYDRKAPHLPKTIIAKMPTTFESALAVARLFKTYEREIRFYSEIAPESPLRTPSLIYCDFDSAAERYCLLIEDCSRYAQVDQIVGLNKEQMEQVTRVLADFHAYWWDHEKLDSLTWIPRPDGPEALALIDTFRGCWDVSIQIKEFVEALPEGGREAGLKVYENFHLLIEKAPKNHLTISHFDFRVDNLFFDPDNRENPIIIFDWGAAVIHRGVIDLSYFLGGSLEIDLRRQIEREIVSLYHERLLEKGVSGYSFDECWQDYMMGTLIYAYIPVLAFASLDTSDERAKILGPLVTTRHFATIVDNNATSVFP
jgi:thiamine kinase-like enzyme